MSVIDPKDLLLFSDSSEDEPGEARDQMPSQAVTPRDELLNGLIENAFDFLERSINEFKAHPKYSVIHFASAVELFLKTRLMAEHWTLIIDRSKPVEKTKGLNRKEFESGNFKSLAPEQAVFLLEKVLGSKLLKEAAIAFTAIRKHRNELIHFHKNLEDETVLQSIVREQCRAWYHLKELLLDEWRAVFIPYQAALYSVDVKMKRHGEYLDEVYKKRASEIDKLRKKNHVIQACPVCHYEALGLPLTVGLSEEICFVCDHNPTVVGVRCPKCNDIVHFVGYSDPFECPHCGEVEIDSQVIFDELDHSSYEDPLHVHCPYCINEDTVIAVEAEGQSTTYLCVDCFAVSHQLASCDWCGDTFIDFDNSKSYWMGCEHCDGQWDKD